MAGVLRVDGKVGWRPFHSTKSIEERGERVKAEAKKMARNTQPTQDGLSPVEDVPFVLPHDQSMASVTRPVGNSGKALRALVCTAAFCFPLSSECTLGITSTS